MNILQILPELNVGGVETGTVDLARYLVRFGHKAVVVSNGGELVKMLESCGAKHYQLPVHKKSFFSIVKNIPALVDIIKKEEIDIVHARSRAPAWIAFFACRITGRVFITTCHGYYTRHFFSFVMGWAKRVIVLSNVIGRHMIDDFGVPNERIRMIPRSVDLTKFQFTYPDKKRNRYFNVGIIGRITPLKGHLYFIKAMAYVAKEIPDLKIWIIGDAPVSRQAYKEQIQILVKRLGLASCTQFLGTQRDIPQILSHLDAVVLSTVTHEAFGRVIIEAQAAGVPVVATSVGGVVDIIDDGRTGLLVPPREPLSMAEAVIKIYRQPLLAHVLAKNAYNKVKEKYNVELMVKSTLQVYEDALTTRKVLIIKFSSLGDITLSTAALRAIRNKFRENYKISLLVSEESKDALMRCPYIDELLVANFKGKDNGLGGLLRLGSVLRKKDFDLVIDLQNNRKSHLLGFLSLSPERYGYNNKKLGFLLNHKIRDDRRPIDPLTHQFRILKMLGIELEERKLELWPSREDQEYVEELLSAQWLIPTQRLIGINISASIRWQTKSWPISNLVKLCEELERRDLRIVLTGTQQDASSAETIVNQLRDKKIINVCGKTTVNQLACLIRRCAVYISADSSPLHIASAVGTPFIALFGPTDPARHLPPASRYVLIRKDLECAPCYRPRCRHKRCMCLITVDEVLRAIQELLQE
ncbi:MAG: lipopolysaccharide heptosyltransferase II [Candidatus Omnitrophica bacterium]|nr:lipopolysaccharide heptosyltransferase II [Candidatus Omnitrophota bacterium]